jgi:hypothetical protein
VTGYNTCYDPKNISILPKEYINVFHIILGTIKRLFP